MAGTERNRIMNTYKTYIFDLDGTLLDTLNDLHASCNYALRTHGMPERSLEEVRQFVGNGVKKLMERAIPDGLENPLFEETLQTFRQHYLLHNLDTTLPYPGIMEMLQQLKAQGKRIAVVSNKFYAATQDLCKHFFGDTIQVAIGESEDIKKKPAPDTVLEALRQLQVTRQDAVYVGDSEVDVETARNSGIPCISVLWGFRSKSFLLSHGATTFIETPNELTNCKHTV
jgi:phosphoglycolate phosphatase